MNKVELFTEDGRAYQPASVCAVDTWRHVYDIVFWDWGMSDFEARAMAMLGCEIHDEFGANLSAKGMTALKAEFDYSDRGRFWYEWFANRPSSRAMPRYAP